MDDSHVVIVERDRMGLYRREGTMLKRIEQRKLTFQMFRLSESQRAQGIPETLIIPDEWSAYPIRMMLTQQGPPLRAGLT